MEQSLEFISGKTTVMQVAHSYRDIYEVRIIGIHRELIMAIGCGRALSHIYSTRVFKARDGSRKKGDINAIAVKFSSPVARDDVVSSACKLKNTTAHQLFGKGENNGIFVNEVVPGPLFEL